MEKKNNRLLAGFLLLLKSKQVLAVVKSAKFFKPAITVATMLLSIFAYSFSLGVTFAVGFVAMIFVHEIGHVVALRRKNVKASLPVFIPFLGAAVFAPKLDDRDDEAYMAYAGPLFGTLGAVALMLVCLALPHPPVLMVMIVYAALILNLFNLIPISPLDGGRVTQAIGPKFIYVGVALLFVMTLMVQTPGMLLIWIIVLMDAPIRPLWRLRTCIGVGIIMIVMMVAGIGQSQPIWVDVIDVVLVGFLIGLLAVSLKNDQATYEPREQRPQLPAAQRQKWFVWYGVLVAALVGLLIWWHSFLPTEALR